ncbi:PAS domain S-box protein [Oharaeibacter diazotrophicus]|uniref:histidine kinase n=3 Tax=Oharaeibacter diazotrophicus TaxID=1920512 RepID=A0A4R6RFM3_9HYPH|nr:PAS domain S-box protein [Oharaeibacter diazotrophicus]TDP85139.1 PAS/PAC sensor signal transduction histidine kinase [Oharaeibacter diazotrophicus]BBE74109.1 sensor protein FixL [Pleomorphomonas sp. SM30]GLS76203.1 PAS domain-containing sensor histidine kinase [Oharaeibacter diazotrophicus]
MIGERTPIIDHDLEPLPATARWRDTVLSAMPVVAILLLIAVLALIVAFLDGEDRERARTALISDALWVEQTLRFQLATDEDSVARLAIDVAAPEASPARFRERARLIVANNPEVTAVAWIEADGDVRAAVPDLVDAGALPARLPDLARRASFSARPVYGDLRRGEGGQLTVDLAVAVPEGADGRGAVVAVVSVSGLVKRYVPWWIAERYAVRLVDSSGRILTEKARVEPSDRDVVHRISFDPPLRGTELAVAPYRAAGDRAGYALYAAVAGLSALAILSLVLLQRHVARRRLTEQKLRTETAFRRAMEDSLTVGMRARDPNGRILYVNPAFCRMVGHPAEALVGRDPPMPYWLPDELDATRARHDAQIHGELKPTSWETRFRRADGSVFDALLYEAPLVDGDGTVRGWMGSIIDITERKAAAAFAQRQAESLQRSARLVTLGEMATSLAHELNQPLAAISSYAAGSLNLIRRGEAERAAIEGALEKLSAQAQRAGGIIRRIQDFVKKREPRFGPVDLADVVRETIAFASIDARTAGLRIDAELEPDLPPVRADRILVEQVLLNLVRNGAEAMAAVPADRRVLTVTLARDGAEVALEVADRGPGIDPAVADRLFDAFVSTKADGMGIGLNICRTIVELHRGRLQHRPRPGGGTVFTVALPVLVEDVAA